MTLYQAFTGSLVADALALPAHWYYDRGALRRDYGVVDHYMAPRNPHPGSILWRSHYEALNERGEILHDQAQYWGRKEVHYHQFLEAGENTLNLKLARELFTQVTTRGAYDPDTWLNHYLSTPLAQVRTACNRTCGSCEVQGSCKAVEGTFGLLNIVFQGRACYTRSTCSKPPKWRWLPLAHQRRTRGHESSTRPPRSTMTAPSQSSCK